MAQRDNIDQLADLSRAGAIIITPNQRLARALDSALTESLQQSLTAWPTPKVVPINAWLQSLVESQQRLRRIPNKPLAHPLEELDAWLSIMQATDKVVLRPKALAKLAQQAWQTVHDWGLDIEQHRFEFDADTDSQQYLEWHQTFAAQLAGQPWLSFSRTLSEVATKLEAIDDDIVLVGFQSKTPLQERLFQKAKSCIEFNWRADASNASLMAVGANEQWRQAAIWAKAKQQQDTNAKIGICIPSLSVNRDEVLAAFDAVFQPQAILPSVARDLACYDISAGVSLADSAIGSVMLTALRALKSELDLAAWRQQLASPYIELSGAVDTSSALRKFPLPQARLGTLAIWLEPDSAIEPIYELAKTISGKANLATWAQQIKEYLAAWGWPGTRSLSSPEYQQHQACLAALQQFSQLRLKQQTFGFGKALDLLQDVFTHKVFHLQTPATNISILGSLEAAGQVFDYLWVGDMEDSRWPPPVAPNPFIPAPLQQRLQMPRGSTEREFQYAERMLNDFATAAKDVVFSYVAVVDAIESVPSRILRGVENFSELSPLSASAAAVQPRFSYPDDDSAETAASERSVTASVLRSQSECPFKAFAKHRLQLPETVRQQYGISAADRGVLLHKALEAFYAEKASSDFYSGLDEAVTHEKVIGSVKLAVNQFPAKLRRLYSKELIAIESERLQKVLFRWLEAGDSRTQSYDIAALEAERKIQLGGLDVSVRIDRIDAQQGQWFVIDYKSGKAKPNWQQERLLDPQLPLYALALKDATVCGIAIAHVRTDQPGFHGLGNEAAEAIRKPLADEAWQGLLNTWTNQLDALAQSYSAGSHQVDPINKAICTYCDYESLCRKFEAVEHGS